MNREILEIFFQGFLGYINRGIFKNIFNNVFLDNTGGFKNIEKYLKKIYKKMAVEFLINIILRTS